MVEYLFFVIIFTIVLSMTMLNCLSKNTEIKIVAPWGRG